MVKGLLPPAVPSSAVARGSVAKAIRMPEADCVSIAVRPRVRRATWRRAGARKGLVAAGVEDDDVDALVALHLAQHELDVDRLEVEIGLRPQRGVDRQEVVLVADGDAVAGDK